MEMRKMISVENRIQAFRCKHENKINQSLNIWKAPLNWPYKLLTHDVFVAPCR